MRKLLFYNETLLSEFIPLIEAFYLCRDAKIALSCST